MMKVGHEVNFDATYDDHQNSLCLQNMFLSNLDVLHALYIIDLIV